MYDSPYPVAATILDLAKLHLYSYYYDVLKPAFSPDKVSLIMTDTDSLIFSVNCKNFFQKYKKLPLFDFSNFKTDNYLYSDKNRKALLFFKDENPNDFIKEFIAFEVNCMLLKLCPIKKTKNVKVITESLEIPF